MISFPNCKINLGLHVIEKRNDGFHNIETVFFPLPFCDVLEIVEHKKITSLTNYGLPINVDDEKNLCMKAYLLLSNDFDLPPVSIYLLKNIPTGAGLGGGSSDATHTLLLLNDLFSLEIPTNKIIEYSRKLGSDCAFFIENKTVYAYGKGDQFENIQLNLKGLYLVIVIPNVSVSTVDAYSAIKPTLQLKSVKEIIQQPIQKWEKLLTNDFEKVVFDQYPEVKILKETLYSKGAIYSSMSGSGSAVYGLFDKEVEVSAHFKNHKIWTGFL